MYIIKSGALFDVTDNVEKEFSSPFAEEFYQEDVRAWDGKSWKYAGGQQNPAQGGLLPRGMLWGGRGSKPPAHVSFQYVCQAPGRLYYVLEMSSSCGLFYYDFATGQEMRLFHRNDFKPRGMFVDDQRGILCASMENDGSAHLVQYDAEGKRPQTLTGGDCRDENPTLHDGAVYYQSSGLARDAHGNVVAASPSTINKLILSTGDIETVVESEKFDYLLPRVAADGALYAIRTPHLNGPVYPLKNLFLDILLFPWRLCVAIFGFLNAFSLFFAQKPLTTAGGPTRPPVNVSARMMHNRLVNAEETWRKEGANRIPGIRPIS